ncbi:MAG: hypothetical protein ACKVQB_11375 [Bacteroidia bacterium]
MLSGKGKFNYAYWILPILVYLITFGFAELLAWIGSCHGWWGYCWSRYDSGLYLEISEIGHTLFPCGIEQGYAPGSNKWCGNAGWAPFYPFLIYLFHLVSGLPSSVCGVVLSHSFFIGFLYVSALIIKIQSFKFSNWLTLFICALCPGGIYFFSIFPISLLILLISFIFWSISIKKFQYSIIPAHLIAISYSSAIIIFFSIGVYMIYMFLIDWKNKKLFDFWLEIKRQWCLENSYRAIFLNILIPGLLGLLSLYFYDWMVTGRWDAMYMVQNKYGHLLYSPFKHLEKHYQFFISHINTIEAWIDFHNIFFFFAMPLLIYVLAKNKNPLTPLLIIYTLIMWYIPFSIGINVSLYRSIALLAPVMAFINPVGNFKKIVMLAIFGVFYYFLGILFFQSILH